MAAAAFFDLDRTLIRRSSVLALAPSFQKRGLISRRDLAKSAFWQLLFVLRGGLPLRGVCGRPVRLLQHRRVRLPGGVLLRRGMRLRL